MYIKLAAAALFFATPALAQDAALFPYHTTANYRPAGLQPVSIGGVICCGQPNQAMSYQQAMAHPVTKRKVVRKVKHTARRMVCPAGEKGCYYE